ncbi:hypothetical protein DOTSEDRAFT_69592 [Dothistroma septosporum NZE10]|uniref:Uncharacterized protein n=1 Tax=Dothistroma septosporum (strain NZE10 / CBS 128990) TaxID=675120 RepID=N1PWC3_DOTSN|nr:hypothetical protein DOTSEDRAFT_69592 [Dothistroma septosporum NZE10]
MRAIHFLDSGIDIRNSVASMRNLTKMRRRIRPSRTRYIIDDNDADYDLQTGRPCRSAGYAAAWERLGPTQMAIQSVLLVN